MGIIEIIAVVGLLLLAGVQVIKDAVVDGISQIRNPGSEAPSLVNRRARADIAQKRAAARVELAELQAAAGVPPAPGQVVADRLARFIADPPPWPSWIIAALNYLGLLLSNRIARAQRRHVANEAARLQRERGEQVRRHDREGPYCWRCDVNHVAQDGDLCRPCARRVTTPCSGCGTHTPIVKLRDGRCMPCRAADRGTGQQATEDPGPIHLVVPMLPAAQPDLQHHL
jgi:hypothetical protein